MKLPISNNYFEKLSDKDIRAVKLGAAGVLMIFLYAWVINPWVNDWKYTREALAQQIKKIESIRPGAAKQQGLLNVVPVCEVPKDEKRQRLLFERKFNEQLKKAGIKVNSLKFVSKSRAQKGAALRLLLLQARAECSFEQILKLLAGLNENPYLVGIEQIRFGCDGKNRKKMDIDLTVSTFAK